MQAHSKCLITDYLLTIELRTVYDSQSGIYQLNSFASAPINIVRIRTMDVAKHISGLV